MHRTPSLTDGDLQVPVPAVGLPTPTPLQPAPHQTPSSVTL